MAISDASSLHPVAPVPISRMGTVSRMAAPSVRLPFRSPAPDATPQTSMYGNTAMGSVKSVRQPALAPPTVSQLETGGAVEKQPAVAGGEMEEKKAAPTIDEQNVLIRCMCEFLAVVLFVFVGVSYSQSSSKENALLHSALVHGLAITLLATIFGRLSGGHVNPAVTCGVALVGKMPPIPATCYVISQLAGSLMGALLTRAVFTTSTLDNIGATLVAKQFNWHSALIVEAVGTMFLVLVVLLSAVDTKKNTMAPLAIGLTLTTNILAIGKVSGGSLNPARSFGPNVVGSMFLASTVIPEHFWTWHAIYYGGPLIGAMLAAAAFRVFFARQNRVIQ